MKNLLLTIGLTFMVIICKSQDSVNTEGKHFLKTQNGDEFYILNSSIKKEQESHTFKAWIVFTNPPANYVNTKQKIDECKGLFSVKCDEDKIWQRSQTVYNPNGIVISSYSLEDYQAKYDDIVPGTIGEMIVNYICQYAEENNIK